MTIFVRQDVSNLDKNCVVSDTLCIYLNLLILGFASLSLPLGRTHVARSCKVFLVGGGGGGECDGDSGETLWPASVEAALALGLC